MAATESTTPRPVQSQQGTFDLNRFRQLLNRRDVAAYQLVGVAMTAMAYMNLGEFGKAQNILQGAVLDYQLADDAINQFHQEVSDGHAAA